MPTVAPYVPPIYIPPTTNSGCSAPVFEPGSFGSIISQGIFLIIIAAFAVLLIMACIFLYNMMEDILIDMGINQRKEELKELKEEVAHYKKSLEDIMRERDLIIHDND